MSCPLYIDHARNCIGTFPIIVQIGTDDHCRSTKEYHQCPFYRILRENHSCCEFLEQCAVDLMEHYPYQKITGLHELEAHSVLSYCLFEDCKIKCAIYKLKKMKQNIPKGLLPDGMIVEFENEK